MTKEFNLSEHEVVAGYFPKDKVKEFIKKLNKYITKNVYSNQPKKLLKRRIKKLAGEELINSPQVKSPNKIFFSQPEDKEK